MPFKFKIVTIVGARPQFVKAAPLSLSLKKQGIREVLVHTGQHYDANMSDIFFKELGLPKAQYHLGVGGLSHGAQTGRMLEKIETVLKREKPAAEIVLGDTDSTLAGALAASKMGIPLIHIESGLRSYNWTMPEEINRVITDHASDILFCPSVVAKKNLQKEGICTGVFVVGDLMIDNARHLRAKAKPSVEVRALQLVKKKFNLLTIHRPDNADQVDNLEQILRGCEHSKTLTVFPCHPRTRRNALRILKKIKSKNIHLVEPQGLLSMLWLTQFAARVITDSGGLQKEAYVLKVPCITVRPQTVWIETLHHGWNRLVAPDKQRIIAALYKTPRLSTWKALYGNGKSAEKISKIIKQLF